MRKFQKISCFFCMENSFDIVWEKETKGDGSWKEKISRAEKLTNERKAVRMFLQTKCNKFVTNVITVSYTHLKLPTILLV